MGPGAQGRLEINRISTPNFVADTGKFKFEVYKDESYTNLIAYTNPGVFVPKRDIVPGEIGNIDITPGLTLI